MKTKAPKKDKWVLFNLKVPATDLHQWRKDAKRLSQGNLSAHIRKRLNRYEPGGVMAAKRK